jgi:hypothetical protein
LADSIANRVPTEQRHRKQVDDITKCGTNTILILQPSTTTVQQGMSPHAHRDNDRKPDVDQANYQYDNNTNTERAIQGWVGRLAKSGSYVSSNTFEP